MNCTPRTKEFVHIERQRRKTLKLNRENDIKIKTTYKQTNKRRIYRAY
jgi:hypothetical protein